MKSELKENISRDLESLQAHLRKIERQEKKLNTCQSDMTEMQAKIEQIGEPSYKNEAAITELSGLKYRLDLCQKEATELSVQLRPLHSELSDVVGNASVRASRLLQPLIDNRIGTIAAVLRPFCATEENARKVARATDAGRQASSAAARVVAQPGLVGVRLLRHTRLCIAIFEEALKKDGDLIQFLGPSEVSGSGESAEVTAS